MRYLENKTYREDMEAIMDHTRGFARLREKKILILGATGLIGSALTDCLRYANAVHGMDTRVYAASRHIEQLEQRFGEPDGKYLHFMETDVTRLKSSEPFDYIIPGAGYGHPGAFMEKPVEVLLSNVAGLHKVLETAGGNGQCRVLYLSSGEAGQEVDHLRTRACYPMGKKTAETLCLCYHKEYGTDVVIARPCHTFGPWVKMGDNRATAQFLAAAAAGRDIEMYSAGSQVRSFSYVADCVSGLLSALLLGESANVYGIAGGEACTVRKFAGYCAAAGGCRVTMHLPDAREKAQTSPIKDQIVENGALKGLGWSPCYTIEAGIARSVRMMREERGG